ncbi:hypothetical protein M2164_005903 [Streptomyces sp. SAI-208]|uniref:hypothetical protein n=1 Tax=Streptomyces sp. SAI-208 TaxID=2940550 RepID=UPI002476E147|nr:hypothetical protein [Streptomyces sp. SAI-208]MDH6610268.1 hypothetical protein [Streptomyces sp. SAI-208]
MKVIRTMPPEGWVPVSNSTAQQRRLSWRAKGLLVDLLSFPDGYHITFDKLMNLAKLAGDPDVEGRDAMRRAMQELERKGYLSHRRVKVEAPKPGGQRWRTETAICDEPIFAENPGSTGFQEAQKPGPPDFGSSRDQEVFSNTGFHKNGQQQEEAGKHSASLALAREGQQARAQDRESRRAQLDRLYEAANSLDDDRLRRLLLQFEQKRRRIYRECRNDAIGQLQREDPMILKSSSSVRAIDLLSYKYALQHYAEKGLPTWLVRFPLRSVS